jgi:hypothetical protein
VRPLPDDSDSDSEPERGESNSQAEGQVEQMRSCTVSSQTKIDGMCKLGQLNVSHSKMLFRLSAGLSYSPTIFSASAFFCS